MSITVRSHEGEVRFESLDEVWQAVRAGLVSLDDEIQTADEPGWTKIVDLPVPASSPWERINSWYVLAAILIVEVLAGFGPLVLILTIGVHATWLFTVKKGGRRSLRWW